MRPHSFNTDFRHLPDLHAQQVAALLDQFPVAFGREFLILILLHKAFDFQIADAVRTHPRAGLDNAGQLIHGEQALFHIAFRFHVRADAPAVAHDRPNILLRNERQQLFFRMLQMLLRILLIIIIMQHSDRLPVLPVFSEIIRHGTHGIADVFRVNDQVFLRHHCRVQFRGSFQAQHRGSSFIVTICS